MLEQGVCNDLTIITTTCVVRTTPWSEELNEPNVTISSLLYKILYREFDIIIRERTASVKETTLPLSSATTRATHRHSTNTDTIFIDLSEKTQRADDITSESQRRDFCLSVAVLSYYFLTFNNQLMIRWLMLSYYHCARYQLALN